MDTDESVDYSDMKVIVVDDDAMILRSLKVALADFGLNVTTFDDPKKAIGWIQENGVDIVISDIYMPDCDGFQLLKQVKEIDPQCDLIFITAHGHVDIAIRALREGATDFFEKPPDHPLGITIHVAVRGIDVVDPPIVSRHKKGFIGKRARTEREFRNVKAGSSQTPVIHGIFFDPILGALGGNESG